MKKDIVDLVTEYRSVEGRITRFNQMIRSPKLSYYFLGAWTKDENADPIADEDFSDKVSINRLKEFLKNEIRVEKTKLRTLTENIISQIKDKKL